MGRQLVYDWPTRVFHWLFAGLFLTAFVIVKTIDFQSPIYVFHMLAGLTMGFLILLRIIWGLVGTKHARFSSFSLRFTDLAAYIFGILKNHKKTWAGHNPASSWAAVGMLTLGLGLTVTGYLMTSGSSEWDFEDIHEFFADGLMALVILHVSGILLHTFRTKEVIGLSMLDGKKEAVVEKDQIRSSYPVIGMILIALVVAFAIQLVNNYDSKTGTLKLFGSTLQLSD